MRRTVSAAFCMLAAAFAPTQAAHAQTTPLYFESPSTAAADATYFYPPRGRQAHEKDVILVFNSAAGQLDGAAALLVSQSIDCATGRITTERYAAFGDDGALLHESRAIPDTIAATIGAEIWAEDLRSSCEPPTPQPIPVSIDPPPSAVPDRNFNGRVADAAEAVALMRRRDEARAQAAMLTAEGRWGSFTRDRFGAGAFIDYARSEPGHMSYLAYAGPYERDWLYARARYAIDCAAQTAFVEYFATYNYADQIVGVSGPSRQMPIGATSARDALAAFCASPAPRGRTYATVQVALAQLLREMTGN